MVYLLWKLVHIVSVVLFLGNITTGLFWAARAHRTRDFDKIAATFDGIVQSDRWFTMPGVIGILVSGVAAALHANLPLLGTSWILWPIGLFAFSGIVFGLRVAPLQRRIAAMAHAPQADRAQYADTYRAWELWGLVALLAPVLALAIMVLKPALPGL